MMQWSGMWVAYYAEQCVITRDSENECLAEAIRRYGTDGGFAIHCVEPERVERLSTARNAMFAAAGVPNLPASPAEADALTFEQAICVGKIVADTLLELRSRRGLREAFEQINEVILGEIVRDLCARVTPEALRLVTDEREACAAVCDAEATDTEEVVRSVLCDGSPDAVVKWSNAVVALRHVAATIRARRETP